MATPIPRPVLVQAVLAGTERHPLTLIIAPPVSGKATLIRQVMESLEMRGTRVSASLDDPADVTVATDFDRLDTAERARARLAIERRVEAGGRVILTSERPAIDEFARSRLCGQVREFGPSDLALRPEEASRFLGEGFGGARASREIRVLLDRTEGWIAAWNLIRGRIERGQSLAEIAASFTGAEPALGRYFEQHVIAGCDDDVRRLLLTIGPLERASPDLVNAVTGRGDGLTLLERATRQCAFFFGDPGHGDGGSDWRRPHRLFQDYLRHRGERDDPEGLRRAFSRAAAWHADRADWLGAAQLFQDAGEPDASAEILNRRAQALITGRGEGRRQSQRVANLSKRASRSAAPDSELALGAILSGDFAGAAALLDQLAPDLESLPAAARGRFDAMRLNIDFSFERFDRVIAVAPRWLEAHADLDPMFRVIVAQALFWSCFAQLDSLGSFRAIAIARAETAKVSSSFLNGWLCLASGIHKWEHGQALAADSLLAEAAGEGVLQHMLNLMRAAVARERGELIRSRRLIDQSLRDGARHGVVEISLLGWETAARLALDDGGVPAALALLLDAETLMASRHGERARRLVRLSRGKILLQSPADNRPSDLGAELAAICAEAAAPGQCRSLAEVARLTLARRQALHGQPRQAVSLLQPILRLTRRQGRLRAWTEASIIEAGALARMEAPNRAARVAWEAAEQLAAGGGGATLWDEDSLLEPLIEALVGRAAIAEANGESGAAAIIRRLADPAARRPATPAASAAKDADLPIQLTDMERRIMTLVAQGLSNRDVAERLLIRESTVKWHLHNIFGKLAVRSRTAALVETRRLGLIA